MEPLKEFKTFEEQIAILEDRGIIINDKNYALKILSWVNYYRLSGYLLPFQKIDPNTNKRIEKIDKAGKKYYQLIDNLHFETIVKIYNFDNELRLFLLSLLVEIETYLKTQIAYFHGEKFGPLGYLNHEESFCKKEANKLNEKLWKEIKNKIKHRGQRSNNLIIQHHKKKYSDEMPIWVIVEFLLFGQLRKFLGNWKIDLLNNFGVHLFDSLKIKTKFIKDKVTRFRKKYQENDNWKVLLNWIENCAFLRNWCAHLSRLYFFKFNANKGPNLKHNSFVKIKECYLYNYFLLMKEIFPNKDLWNKKINNELSVLFEKYKNEIQLNHIGFPQLWRAELINTN